VSASMQGSKLKADSREKEGETSSVEEQPLLGSYIRATKLP